jgi:hypothetical protein
MTLTALTTTALVALAASKGAKPTLRYTPPADSEDERPVATATTVKAKGNDYTFDITFNHEPWGEGCKARCANATFFLDTDGNKKTGLQLGDKSAQTGADLAVVVQGIREYKEVSAESLLRVKVRALGNESAELEQGQVVAELDQRHDPERVKAKGKDVSLKIDTTTANLPVGRTVRVVYQPPGATAVVATIPGFGSGNGGAIQIVRGKRR